MVVFRFLSNPSFLGFFVPNFDVLLKTHQKGCEVRDVFATPDLPSIVNMAEQANRIAYEMDGGMACSYVAVIRAYEWTDDTKGHPKKYSHHPLFDSHEIIVLRGVVKELLPFSNDRWQPHKITFIEKYGMDFPTIIERYPNYKKLMTQGIITNLVSWS